MYKVIYTVKEIHYDYIVVSIEGVDNDEIVFEEFYGKIGDKCVATEEGFKYVSN